MDKHDIVRAAFSFDTDATGEHLADNFQGTDSVGGDAVNKEMWIGMGHVFQAAIPDIDFVIENIEDDGDDVLVTGRFTGTFTNDLDLSAAGFGTIPATGQAINIPSSTSRISFEGDKIVRNHDLSTGSDAGLGGFLAGLGADMG